MALFMPTECNMPVVTRHAWTFMVYCLRNKRLAVVRHQIFSSVWIMFEIQSKQHNKMRKAHSKYLQKKAEEKLQTTLETTVNRLLPLQTFLIKATMSPFHVYSVCAPSLRLESTCLDSISSRPNEAHCSRFRMSHFSRSTRASIANSDKYTFWHGFIFHFLDTFISITCSLSKQPEQWIFFAWKKRSREREEKKTFTINE